MYMFVLSLLLTGRVIAFFKLSWTGILSWDWWKTFRTCWTLFYQQNKTRRKRYAPAPFERSCLNNLVMFCDVRTWLPTVASVTRTDWREKWLTKFVRRRGVRSPSIATACSRFDQSNIIYDDVTLLSHSFTLLCSGCVRYRPTDRVLTSSSESVHTAARL